MLIYNLIPLFIILLGILLCEWKKSKRNDLIFLVIASVTMIFIAAVRTDTVGIDYKMYEQYFNQVRTGGWAYLISGANGYRIEFGFSLLNFLVSRFTGDVHVFMTVASLLCVGLTAVFVYKYSPIPWVSMFVFAAYGFYGNSLSFIRQTLAIAIFLFAVPYIMKRKFLPFLIILIVAALFHKSILIMLVAYWICWFPVNWKTLTAYLAAMAAVMIVSWPAILFITKYIFTYYGTQEGLYYVVLGRNWNTAFIPVVTAVVAVILMKYLLRRNPANLVLINLSVFGSILYIMTCQRFIFQRIAMMFYAVAILLIPEILKSIGVDSGEAEEYQQIKAGLKKKSAQEKKAAYAESRKIKTSMNTRKYVYYYSVAAVIFFGFLYNAFLLFANRINLVPYITYL